MRLGCLMGLGLVVSVGASANELADLRQETPFLDSLSAYEPASFVEQSIRIPAREIQAVLDADLDQPLSLPTLNGAFAKGQALRFERVDLYAPGAQIHVRTQAGSHTLMASDRTFAVGRSATGSASLAIDTRSSKVSGLFIDGGESYRLVGRIEQSGDATLQLINLREEIASTPFQCGTTPDDGKPIDADDDVLLTFPSRSAIPKGGPILYSTTIAVDTDTAFTSQGRFNGSASQVRNYIEDMFAGMTAIYERDMQLRVMLGTTFINMADDPYTSNVGLSEFAQFWATDPSRQGIDRDFAALLGGLNGGGFSGVAFVNTYCSTSSGYSFNGIGSGFSAAAAAEFVGHEIGHNLGSSHTHCERLANGGTDYVDECYSCEDYDNNGNCLDSCYVGPTMCQPGNTGTVMSYCHAGPAGFDGAGPATGTTANCTLTGQFHPLIVGKLSNLLAANNPQCIDSFLPAGDFTVDVALDDVAVCKPADAVNTVTVAARNGTGFSDPVDLSISGLPTALTAAFMPTSVTPGLDSTLTIGNTTAIDDGTFNITVVGSTATAQTTASFNLFLVSPAASAPVLTAPDNGAPAESVDVLLDWEAVSGATSYRVDVATDAGFGSITESATVSETAYRPSMLIPQTTYFWRVVPNAGCGEDNASETRLFTTRLEICRSPNLAIPDSGSASDTMTVMTAGNVEDLNVFVDVTADFGGAYGVSLDRISDNQSISLKDPTFGCNVTSEPILTTFDDEAAITERDASCTNEGPNTSGLLDDDISLRPSDSLSAFDGGPAGTQWRLTVSDVFSGPGTLNRWCLFPTLDGPAPVDNMLSITVNGPGRVTSSPAGLDCPGACSALFPSTITVILTEMPNAQAQFDGWDQDCSGAGACSVMMSSDRMVTADFSASPSTSTLTVSVTGPGQVTSTPAGINCPGTCSAAFDTGTNVSLSQSPEGDATFIMWGEACSGTGACSVILNDDSSVSATFQDDDIVLISGFEEGEGPAR